MISLILLDQEGAAISPQNLASAADLREVVDKARALIRECERLAQLKANPKLAAGYGRAPYSS